jgi:hypothetical protein
MTQKSDSRKVPISTKVTEDERGKIAQYCTAKGVDVSTLMRAAVLREVEYALSEQDGQSGDVGQVGMRVEAMAKRLESLIEIVVVTKGEELVLGEAGKQLTVGKFMDICKAAREPNILRPAKVGNGAAPAGRPVPNPDGVPVNDVPPEPYREAYQIPLS